MANFTTYLIVFLASMILIGIIIMTVRYVRAINAAHKRLDRLGSRVIETACGPIEFYHFGRGYPLLVIHGAMGGFDQGLWLAQSFDLSHYQVISVSRFGYLRSPLPPNANLDLQADTFASLLDTLGIPQAAVFAVSAGSTSAIRFAARHPEHISALILLSPDAPGEIQAEMPSRFTFDVLLRSDFVYWVMITFFGKSVQKLIGLAPRDYALSTDRPP